MLTDPDDMLATGIDFEARPPGKKVKRLSLLSGGERALTAIAFLVAIFKARPSPFYVLDEVEAALDDTNLQRLLRPFEELRESSQLIIVTHQKRTMEVADSLYGISMRGRRRVHRGQPAPAGTRERLRCVPPCRSRPARLPDWGSHGIPDHHHRHRGRAQRRRRLPAGFVTTRPAPRPRRRRRSPRPPERAARGHRRALRCRRGGLDLATEAVAEPAAPEIEVPPPSAGRMVRLRGRLARSQSAFGSVLLGLLSRDTLDDEAWEEIEDTLITADVGVAPARHLVEQLRTEVKVTGSKDVRVGLLRAQLIEAIGAGPGPVAAGQPARRAVPRCCWWSGSTAPARPPPAGSWPAC